ncbi:bifunctional adenosylcobinamide kinase/adenosylcobinamide-phosphate guanylyltransferase [Corynebacterium crudilactis]|uniref:Adenosylcobinamide kinase n=1 Tax=Corynebacterium crudilactis TaxID=1652495 RepID=A0A172QUP9_9CORY|nr:bifunctional adenosylcobinamide kinase/adenosylcobinamide-phosphate guanylyltransferase [Corynebacterium crudilactis]ANE04439.1 adenosylcobinamide kinase/adenosylcobinamide phosphate guanyltransferase [Corynebacterium crudilactis]
MRTLVLGGARSGKSVFAESLVGSGPVLYVATARSFGDDKEFSQRIAIHAQRRPASWLVNDEEDVEKLLTSPPAMPVLVDDLGTWLTHATDQCGAQAWEAPSAPLDAKIEALIDAIRHFPGDDLVIVSPEVGMGIIPEFKSGRIFRDRIGTLNQQIAEICERVVFVVAGLPLELKTF